MVRRMIWVVMVVWFFSAATAEATGLEVSAGGWIQDPSGSVGYKALSAADLLDIEQDLQYDTKTRVQGPFFEIGLKF